jgi:hypothetical protein
VWTGGALREKNLFMGSRADAKEVHMRCIVWCCVVLCDVMRCDVML